MAGLLPGNVYELTENMLRRRDKLVPMAQIALYRAQAAVQSAAPAARRKAEKRAARCEQALIAARAWVGAIRLVERIFPESTEEGKLACLMYQDGMSLNQAARVLGIRRQTASRKKDNFIGHLALIAASQGLISIGKKEAD